MLRLGHHAHGGEEADGELGARHVVVDGLGNAHPGNADALQQAVEQAHAAVPADDHEGTRAGRIQQWDGAKWVVVSDWYQSDDKVLKPMVDAAAKKYADEKKLPVRDCSKES